MNFLDKLSALIKEHGPMTVIAGVGIAVMLWGGWKMTQELKDQQMYTRDRLTTITEKSIEAHTKSIEAIEDVVEAGGETVEAIENNTEVLKKVLVKMGEGQ